MTAIGTPPAASPAMERRILRVRRLGVTCVALTFLLMVLGAWVKANQAGLSCPDWPACYGKLIPPFPSMENGGVWHGQPVAYTQAQELYEWTHRAVVGLILIPVAAFAFLAATCRSLRPSLRALPVAAVAIYFVQAALGAITVVTGNPPWATTLHLATAVTWFATLVVATCVAHLSPTAAPSPARPAPFAPATPGGVRFVYPGEDASTPPPRFPGEDGTPHGQ